MFYKVGPWNRPVDLIIPVTHRDCCFRIFSGLELNRAWHGMTLIKFWAETLNKRFKVRPTKARSQTQVRGPFGHWDPWLFCHFLLHFRSPVPGNPHEKWKINTNHLLFFKTKWSLFSSLLPVSLSECLKTFFLILTEGQNVRSFRRFEITSLFWVKVLWFVFKLISIELNSNVSPSFKPNGTKISWCAWLPLTSNFWLV
jgi:hypothetical protein